MPTETTRKDDEAQTPSVPATVRTEESELRAAARESAKRVRRFKIHLVAWIVGASLLTALWVVNAGTSCGRPTAASRTNPAPSAKSPSTTRATSAPAASYRRRPARTASAAAQNPPARGRRSRRSPRRDRSSGSVAPAARRAGRYTRAGRAARPGSCTRIARCSCRSSGPGSIPSASTSTARACRKASSASAWRPAR